MFGGREGHGAKIARQLEAQSFMEEMKLPLIMNIRDNWFDGHGGRQHLENVLTKDTGTGVGEAHLRVFLIGVGEQSR